MVSRMTRPADTETPAYWAAAAEARYIPAADYVARMRAASIPETARVARCTSCGQWTWDGSCSLHPDARQDIY